MNSPIPTHPIQVKILRDDARVRLANQVNLTEAVRVALLTLPERFSEKELFERIAGISYVGDFRMVVGENPNKVRNIVDAQMSHFHRLYYGLLDDLPNVTSLNDGYYQVNEKKKNTREWTQPHQGITITILTHFCLAKPKPAFPWPDGPETAEFLV